MFRSAHTRLTRLRWWSCHSFRFSRIPRKGHHSYRSIDQLIIIPEDGSQQSETLCDAGRRALTGTISVRADGGAGPPVQRLRDAPMFFPRGLEPTSSETPTSTPTCTLRGRWRTVKSSRLSLSTSALLSKSLRFLSPSEWGRHGPEVHMHVAAIVCDVTTVQSSVHPFI